MTGPRSRVVNKLNLRNKAAELAVPLHCTEDARGRWLETKPHFHACSLHSQHCPKCSWIVPDLWLPIGVSWFPTGPLFRTPVQLRGWELVGFFFGAARACRVNHLLRKTSDVDYFGVNSLKLKQSLDSNYISSEGVLLGLIELCSIVMPARCTFITDSVDRK